MSRPNHAARRRSAGAARRLLALAAVVLAASALAGCSGVRRYNFSPSPVVHSFTVTPALLSWRGGSVAITASTANANRCVVTTSPQLPALVADVPSCSEISHTFKLVLPRNYTVAPTYYWFNIIAIGKNGRVDGSPVRIEVDKAPTIITSLEASPSSFPEAGGVLHLTGKVTNAVSCQFRSDPGLADLPRRARCSTGVVRSSLRLQANQLRKPEVYRVILIARQYGRRMQRASVVVTVAGLPGATVTSSSVTPSQLGAGGGLLTVTAAVANATTCLLNVRGPILIHREASCSSGTFSEQLLIPANRSKNPEAYTLVLSLLSGHQRVRVPLTHVKIAGS